MLPRPASLLLPSVLIALTVGCATACRSADPVDWELRSFEVPPADLVAAAACLALLVLGWPRHPGGPRLLDGAAAEHYPSLAALGLAAPPSEPVTPLPGKGGGPMTLRRVEVRTPSVVFYLVEAAQR
jgi:hypothetical protein